MKYLKELKVGEKFKDKDKIWKVTSKEIWGIITCEDESGDTIELPKYLVVEPV